MALWGTGVPSRPAQAPPKTRLRRSKPGMKQLLRRIKIVFPKVKYNVPNIETEVDFDHVTSERTGSPLPRRGHGARGQSAASPCTRDQTAGRSEEHTSEL